MILFTPSFTYPRELWPLSIPLFLRFATVFPNRVLRLFWKVCRASAQVVTPPPSICVPLLARLLVGCFFHEFHLLDGCGFGSYGMMDEGGIFLISDLEASFVWIPVIAKGGRGSWSAIRKKKRWKKIGKKEKQFC
ncbi:unnamed protein product [Malus baccata var. baccata]